jgi:ATP-dependent helicase/nuclease subunit B
MLVVTVLQTTDTSLSDRLLGRYARACAEGGPDSAALLLPTARVAEEARLRLASGRQGGLFDPRVMTFPQLAEALLIANHHPFRSLSDLQRQALVADLLQSLPAGPETELVTRLADRPGVAAAVLRLLDDLKRGAVHPDDFVPRVADRLPGHAANAAVGALYAAYQERLKTLGLYDEPGLFWEALDLLRAGRLHPLDDLRVLLLDGFTEFTTTQLQLLQALAPRLEELTLTLCLDPARPALNARTGATLERLREGFGEALTVVPPPDPGPPRTTLERLAACLFRPQEAGLPEMDASLQMLEVAGGATAEAREVARRIKQLLTRPGDPVPPHEVAVVVRSWDNAYETALRQALAGYGLPVEVSRGPALATVPVVRAVLDILDVLRGDWSRNAVVKLLNNSYVNSAAVFERFPGAGAVEQVALEAGVMGGWQDWRQQLRALAAELAAERRARELAEQRLRDDGALADSAFLEDEDGNRLRPLGMISRLQALRAATAMTVNGLHGRLDRLTRARTWDGAAGALGQVITALGIPASARDSAGPAAGVARDLAALKALADALAELAEAPELLGLSPQVTTAAFCDQVVRLCRETRLPAGPRTGSGVQLLDASEARQLRFRHVFVPGLVDGLFPGSGRQDPFYSDDDRGRLEALDRRLAARHDEALLFHAVLSAATETVWLSYPSTSADGSPVLRSAYVEEVLRHFAPGAARVRQRQLSQVIPPAGEVCSRVELAEVAGKGYEGAEAAWLLLRRLDEPLAAHISATAQAESERLRPWEAPGRYDGVLARPDTRGLLATALYGPDHLFSASQLGAYGQCPLSFFLSRVLRLEELREPTPEQEARDLGALAHRALAALLETRQAGRDDSGPLEEEDRAALLATLEEVLARVCDDFERSPRLGHRGLWGLARERLAADLRQAVNLDVDRSVGVGWPKGKDLPPRRVYATEYTYGRGRSFRVETSAGPLYVQGRIDRIDLLAGEGPPRFVVFDYKSGAGASARDLGEGRDFQLALYSLATRAISMGDAPPAPALWAYFRVRRPVAWTPFTENKLPGLEDAAREFMGQHVAAMRCGQFPLAPQSPACRTCDFRTICRRRPRRTTRPSEGATA